jgi:orotate phosphoribosyltransferase
METENTRAQGKRTTSTQAQSSESEGKRVQNSQAQAAQAQNSTPYEIAEGLLSIGAVFLRPNDPFTWASGIKSPIYCDNRLVLTSPNVRDLVESAIVKTIKRAYPGCEALMGTATAGIAHAAISAHIMHIPIGYVRSNSKGHGRQNQIEGRIEIGQKVVVIEDLISTAGSVIEAVQALREAGANVLGIVSIFTYGMQKGIDRLLEAGVSNQSLSNLDALLEVAVEKQYIDEADVSRLLRFRDNPGDESWMEGKERKENTDSKERKDNTVRKERKENTESKEHKDTNSTGENKCAI